MANTTASPSGVNRNFAGPSRNTTDVNTQLIASVETMRRHRNAGGAVQRRGGKIHAFAAQPMGVLDRHRRIVDQDADRERHAAERHGVERVAHEVEDDDRGQDR